MCETQPHAHTYVVGRVKEIGHVADGQLLNHIHQPLDKIVKAEQCPPPLTEEVVDLGRLRCGDRRLLAHDPVMVDRTGIVVGRLEVA